MIATVKDDTEKVWVLNTHQKEDVLWLSKRFLLLSAPHLQSG